MAAETFSGLNATPINPTGLAPEHLQAYMDALKGSADALQARYANPNWFNVAAGFLKPQLGGFAASLGSAGAAMGDWQEKQRANELPVAQMRAELGKVGMLQSQQNQADTMLKSHKGPVTPELLRDLTSLVGSGSPMVQGVANQLKVAQDQQTLAVQEQQALAAKVQAIRAAGGFVPPEMLARLRADFIPLGGTSKNPPPGTGTPPPSAAVPGAAVPSAPVPIAPVPIATVPAPTVNVSADKNSGPIALKLADIQALPPEQRDAAMRQFADSPEGGARKYRYPPPPEGSTPEVAARHVSSAEADEKRSDTRYERLQAVGLPENYDSLVASGEGVLNFIKTQPGMTNKIFNAVRGSGPLAAAAAAGVAAHAGSFTATVSLPVDAYLKAGFTEAEQAATDTLLTNLAKIAGAKLTSAGTTIQNHPQEFSSILASTAGIGQHPKAVAHTIKQDLLDFSHKKQTMDAVDSLTGLMDRSKTLAPRTEAFNDPAIKRISDVHSSVRKKMYEQHHRELGGTQ